MVPNVSFYHPKSRKKSWKRFINLKSIIWIVSVVVFVSSLLATLALYFPDFFYKITPFDPKPIVASVDTSVLGGSWDEGALYATITLPPKDENLPTGNWLVIPKIGIRTEITENPEEKMEDSLKTGVWRVPEFGDPMNPHYPMILIAHRFGYLKWNNAYRRQHSFYNLDKLEVGDTFEVIWDQRRFEYEIYAGEEGKDITDYDADVILYTCKYLNSPIRFFRYARRVEY